MSEKGKRKRGRPTVPYFEGPDAFVIAAFVAQDGKMSLAAIIDKLIQEGQIGLDPDTKTEAHVRRIKRAMKKAVGLLRGSNVVALRPKPRN